MKGLILVKFSGWDLGYDEFGESQVSMRTGVLGAYLGVMVTESELRDEEQ